MKFIRNSRILLYVILTFLFNCRSLIWYPRVTLKASAAIEKTDCILCFETIRKVWSGTIETKKIETKTIQTDSQVLKVNNIILRDNESYKAKYVNYSIMDGKKYLSVEKYMQEVFEALFKDAGIVVTNNEKFPTVYIIINNFETDRVCFPFCHGLWVPALEKRYMYISSEIWIKDGNFVFFTSGSRIYSKFFFRVFTDLFRDGLSEFINESFGMYTLESVQQTKKYLVNANRSK